MTLSGVEKIIFDEQVSDSLNIRNLKRVLMSVMIKNSKDVFCNVEKLREEMKKEDVREVEICLTCLVCSAPIFKNIISKDIKEISNLDFANLVSTVSQFTGLTRPIALGVLEAILLSLNIIKEMPNNKKMDTNLLKKTLVSKDYPACVIPYSAYSDDLKKMNEIIDGKSAEDTSAYIETVRCYAQLGVPRAKYLLARTMDIDDESTEGYKLMQEAAIEGDALAATFLGDYYYKKGSAFWHKALSYYAGYARATLNSRQRGNLICIMNAKELNKRIIFLNIFFTFLTIASLIIIPSFSLFRKKMWIGLVAVVLEIVYNIIGIYNYKRDNYYLQSKVSKSFIIWMLYMIVVIVM